MSSDIAAVDRQFAKSLLKHVPQMSEGLETAVIGLMQRARQGHLCISIPEGLEIPEELIEDVDTDVASPQKPLCRFANLLYLQKNWVAESRFVHHLTRLQSSQEIDRLKIHQIDPRLNAEQHQAVTQALENSISLITGGPGTGKTFVAQAIIQAFSDNFNPDERIAVAAPTGKAAAQLKSAALSDRVDVSTLHALLGIRTARDFQEERAPLPYRAIVIDEASMIDVRLFGALMSRVKVGTHLVLMGDRHQLPPVEAGSLFADLIAIGSIPCAELKQCLRVEKEALLSLAAAVRDGNAELATELMMGPYRLDVGFEEGFSGKIYERLWSLVGPKFTSIFSQKPGAEVTDQMARYRVLSCLRSGPLGVDALNAWFVKQFYTEAKVGQWLAIPILITQNDADQGLFNGQSGVLLSQVHEKASRYQPSENALVLINDREIPASMLPRYEIAYFLSVHKSQGSEYDEVILLAPRGSENFGREVLYTAITRARKTLYVDGNPEVLRQAISISSLKTSGLKHRLS